MSGATALVEYPDISAIASRQIVKTTGNPIYAESGGFVSAV
jgi:hypothetical protein